MSVTHSFVSAKSDGTDTSVVRPSDWNADHVGMPDGSVNVMDYGAVGNGSDNDTTAIHDARDVAGAKTVVFPPGTYLVSGLTANVAGQTWVLASGATIKLANSTVAATITVSAADVSIVGLGLSIVDGSKGTQSGTTDQPGISVSSGGTRVTIRGLEIKDTHGCGVRLNAADYGRIQDCYIHDAGDATWEGYGGIFCDTGTDYVLIEGNRIDACARNGIKVKGDGSSTASINARILGNHVTGTLSPGGNDCLGIEIWGWAHRAVIADNIVYLGTANSQFGISVDDSHHTSISGNVVVSTASSPSYSRFGIEIASSSYCSVTGNTVDFTSNGSGGEDQCVSMSNTKGDGNVVAGNTFRYGKWGVKSTDPQWTASVTGNSFYGHTSAGLIGVGWRHGVIAANAFDTCTVAIELESSSSTGGGQTESVLDMLVADNIAYSGTTFLVLYHPSGTFDRIRVRGNVTNSYTNFKTDSGGGTLGTDIILELNYPDTDDTGTHTVHVASATPTGGRSGDIKVGTGKIWVNDGGTWKSATVSA